MRGGFASRTWHACRVRLRPCWNAAKSAAENHIPPTLLVPLVLGWRDRAELEAIYPDFAVWGASRALFDALFPKMTAFIYPQY